MTAAQVLVLALTTGLAGALIWYFFGPKPAAQQASLTCCVGRNLTRWSRP